MMWITEWHPALVVGVVLLAVGIVLVGGVWMIERGFRKEWETPAEPESWAYRVSQEQPMVRIADQGNRTLVEDWRERLGAEDPGAAGGRHRHRNLEERTQRLDPDVIAALRKVTRRDQL